MFRLIGALSIVVFVGCNSTSRQITREHKFIPPMLQIGYCAAGEPPVWTELSFYDDGYVSLRRPAENEEWRKLTPAESTNLRHRVEARELPVALANAPRATFPCSGEPALTISLGESRHALAARHALFPAAIQSLVEFADTIGRAHFGRAVFGS